MRDYRHKFVLGFAIPSATQSPQDETRTVVLLIEHSKHRKGSTNFNLHGFYTVLVLPCGFVPWTQQLWSSVQRIQRYQTEGSFFHTEHDSACLKLLRYCLEFCLCYIWRPSSLDSIFATTKKHFQT